MKKDYQYVNLDDNTLKDVELEGITRPPVIHANANRMVPIGIDKNFDIKSVSREKYVSLPDQAKKNLDSFLQECKTKI